MANTMVLTHRLNKCGVISPRYDITHGEIENWVARLLPSRLVSSVAKPISAGYIWSCPCTLLPVMLAQYSCMATMVYSIGQSLSKRGLAAVREDYFDNQCRHHGP